MSRRWRIAATLRRARFFPLPPSLTQTVFPSSIPSAESFGTPFINDGVVRPSSIASAESFGTPTITPGPTSVSPTSIVTAESFGTPSLTITFDLARLHRTTTHDLGYELVCVGRLMQPSGPPTFVEIDSILWNGLNHTEELSRPSSLQASAPIETLSEEVLQRLRRMRELPCEMWLYRDGQHVFSGPLTAWSTQGETMTLYAPGLLGYLRYWTIDSDQVFSQVDQFTIVKTLVDNWQNSEYGNFGIVTANVGTSGVVRDATYKRSENHNVGQRVEELGKRENGFNISVDPLTRELQLRYPQQGIDRSTGADAVVFDELSITSTDVAASVAPGDVASDAMATTTGSADPLWATVFDSAVRAQFGRTSVTESFDGVTEADTLNAHLNDMLATRQDALLVPGPNLRVVADIPLSDYGVGDTIAYRLHDRLGVFGNFRIRKRSVSIDKDGVENVTLEFV